MMTKGLAILAGLMMFVVLAFARVPDNKEGEVEKGDLGEDQEEDRSEADEQKIAQEVKLWLASTTQEFQQRYSRPRFSVSNILGPLFIGVVLLIILWGAKDFATWLSLGQKTPQLQVLGTHQNHVYFFNQSTQKVYRYDLQTEQEKEAFDLVPYETFVWSPSRDKIVFISSKHNNLGSLYVVDLTESTPRPKLITERETGINFPSDVIIQGNLPLAWDEYDDRIAFVARKQTEQKDALFVIAADGSEYYRLPEKERITSLAWVKDRIVFVALDSGQEKRFIVNFDGGNLKELE